jgi:hypothetical protein
VLLAVLVFALACRRVGNGRFGRALRLMWKSRSWRPAWAMTCARSSRAPSCPVRH